MMTTPARPQWLIRGLAVVWLTLVTAVSGPHLSSASATIRPLASATDGTRVLEATPVSGLVDGQLVSVSGRGYDEAKGIYVAFCVVPAAGAVPSPCGGGVTTEGSTGASYWISSNPPPYGEGLAIPYGPGGSFGVELRVTPTIAGVDCRRRPCAIVTRNDHTRGSDRSQDVFVPVAFASTPPSTTQPPPSTTQPSTSTTRPAGSPGSSIAPTSTTDPGSTTELTTVRVTEATAVTTATGAKVVETSSSADAHGMVTSTTKRLDAGSDVGGDAQASPSPAGLASDSNSSPGRLAAPVVIAILALVVAGVALEVVRRASRRAP